MTPLPFGQTNASTQQATTSSAPVTRAVVIGISDYQDEDIPDLRFAHRDARAFANWLHLPGGKDIHPDNIMLLLNEDATLGKVVAAMNWIYEESSPGDHSIIYFSGHGDMEAQLFGLGHLLLWDSPAKAYIAGGLPVERLQALVTALSVNNNNKVLLVTDACHSGKLAGNDIVGNKLTNANLAIQFSNEQKILSCQPEEYSIEGEQWGGGRGAFSWHLINGLSGQADENADNNITLLEIEHFLQDHVPPDVEPLSQIPMTVGDKNEVVGTVDSEMIAMLKKGNDLPIQSFSRVEQRGVVQDALAEADTTVIQLFEAFVRAMDEKRLLEPIDNCAESYFNQLVQIESIAPLHAFLRRNLAAAFQEDAQQAINAYLLANQEELNKLSRWDDKYRLYPLYMQKAAELLGPENQFYNSIVARQKYFEGLYLRLFFDVVNSDTLFNRAVQKLQESLELESDAPYVYQELGLLYDRKLEKEKALTYFLEAIERSPSWILPYFGIVDIYRYTNWPDDAYDRIKNAFPLLESKAGPLKWEAYGLRSISANVVGKIDEAEHYIKAAMEMEEVGDWPWYFWGGVLRGRGRLAESEAMLEQAMELFPDIAASYWELGLTKYDLGEIDEFVTLHEKGIDMAPYRAYDYLRFINKLVDVKRYEKALEIIERLFQLDPNYYSDLSNLSSTGTAAMIFDRLGRTEEVRLLNSLPLQQAIGEFKSLFTLFPQITANEEALEKARSIVKKHHIRTDQLLEIGHALVADGHQEYANQISMLAQEMDPASYRIYQQIGWDYLIEGNFESARQNFEEAIKINPSFAGTLYDNAWLHFSFGQKAEAVRMLTESIEEKGVEDLVLYGHRAMLSAFFEPLEEAKKYFEAAVKFHPTMMRTYERLELMENNQFEQADSAYLNFKNEPSTWWETRFMGLAYVRMKIRQGEYKPAINLIDECRLDHYTFNYHYINNDEDFAPLWELPEWTMLMKKYFPNKLGDTTIDSLNNDSSTFPYQANFNRLAGLYYSYNNQHELAIPYFLKSLETALGNNEAKIYLADLYLKTDRKKKAEEILPSNMVSKGLEVYWVAAKASYLLNKPQKAEHYFREFIKKAYNNRYPNNRVGAFYKIHGEFDLAESFLKEDIRLHPDDKTFPPSDCRCESNLDKKDIRLHPTNLTSRLNLALVYFYANELEKSYELLEESIYQEPGQLALQALLAFLKYFENPESAAQYFSQANAIAPGFYQLWDELEHMRNDNFVEADQAWVDLSNRFSDWWVEIVKYHYMKMKIRQGDNDKALQLLKEMLEKRVFINYQFLTNDEGIDPIRNLSIYTNLLMKYFPEKMED